jgi:hypothetical protein
LQSPDSNRLYVVFVQPLLTVSGSGLTDFIGYHASFTNSGFATPIRYAVIPYPGAGNGWATPGFQQTNDTFDSLTTVTSHELAEALTDPDGTGWFDTSSTSGEVGDIPVNQNVSPIFSRLQQYAVQKIANQSDQPVVPPPELTGSGSVTEAFDHSGNFVQDVVYGNGSLYEYDRNGGHFLGTGVLSSSVTFDPSNNLVRVIVYANTHLFQYVAATGTTGTDTSPGSDEGPNALYASAAYDPSGHQVLDVVYTNSNLVEYTFTGATTTATGVQTTNITFENNGFLDHDVVYINSGSLYVYTSAGGLFEGTGFWSSSMAYDPNNNLVQDVVYLNGSWYQYDTTGGHLLGNLHS